MDREVFQELAMAGEAPVTGGETVSRDDDFLTQARAFEKRAHVTIQPLATGFPWPTIFTFLGVLAGVSSVALLAASGYLSLPLHGLSNSFVSATVPNASGYRVLWTHVSPDTSSLSAAAILPLRNGMERAQRRTAHA